MIPRDTEEQGAAGTTPEYEKVINGIFMGQCSDFSLWTNEKLGQEKFTHIIYIDRERNLTKSETEIDQNEFECLELKFQENSRPLMVLPNLYTSVKFISKALTNEGKLLVLENLHQTQNCLTIVLGYLMFNYELNFIEAFETLRTVYRSKFDLDRFFVMQLYEYEPILEVQRAAESRGHSSSGETLRSILKRNRGGGTVVLVKSPPSSGDNDENESLENPTTVARPLLPICTANLNQLSIDEAMD